MKIHNSPWLPLALMAICFIGVGMNFNASETATPGKPATEQNLAAQPAPSKQVWQAEELPDDVDPIAEWQAKIPKIEPTQTSEEQALPGEFRGDWGETPIYARNDRVMHENAAYLSLEDNNQNQPPASSPQFWQLLKQYQAGDGAACLSPLPGADLSQCDFSQHVSLKDKQLRGATLSNSRLAGELGDADLSGANLSGAAIMGSLLIGPNSRVDHANLSNLQSDANNPLLAEAADFNHSDFSAANLSGAKLKQANFSEAKLTSANLSGAQLAASHLDNADLRQADMSFADMSSASFSAADLTAANLSEASLVNGDFSHARLQHASLAGSDLSGADFSAANLRHANLLAVKNADSAIIDAATDFTAAMCPDGKQVDGRRISSCIGHGF